jgi:hypothetical protein
MGTKWSDVIGVLPVGTAIVVGTAWKKRRAIASLLNGFLKSLLRSYHGEIAELYPG